MDQKVNFFDEIEKNKRNSIILLFFISIIFVLSVLAISYIFRFGFIGPFIGFGGLIMYSVVAYFAADKAILAISGAREINSKTHPFVFNVVEGLALASQIPLPKIYLIQDSSPNAFAIGRDPKHASVAVTSGLLGIMNKEELEAVLAHEISHVANYDVRFSLIAIAFVGAIGLLGDIAFRSFGFGFGSGRRDRGSSGLILIALIIAILAPISATLVQLAISRNRESLADANAAKLTRYPAALANALEKIKNANLPTQSANKVTASLYFSDPFPRKFVNLFSTHPPIDERIRKLRSM